jgi:hypothetical protein
MMLGEGYVGVDTENQVVRLQGGDHA